jgi:hypothetical protein
MQSPSLLGTSKGQARADFGMTMMALCYNIKRLGYLKTAGIEAF